MLQEQLRPLIEEFASRHRRRAADLHLTGDDAWSIEAAWRCDPDTRWRIRPLREGDGPALHEFGRQLGPVSRELFCPYPWDEARACDDAFRESIGKSLQRIDASYLLFRDEQAVGHFFLWAAGGNPVSQRHGLQVPELGVALADDLHGNRLGGLMVRWLQIVAAHLRADAIELTTATNNDSGWGTYQSAGFESVGMLRVPLGVNVAAAQAGEVAASRFREERQMVWCINERRREDVLRYLEGKRACAMH